MIKTCPVCGKLFECSHDKNCWCVKITLSETARKELKERYLDCLCENCLKQIATTKK